MNKAKLFTALSLLLLTLLPAAGQEPIKLPDTSIPTQKDAVSRIVKFPAVNFNNSQRVILKGRFYYQRPKGAGWNTASSLAINNKTLRPFTQDKKVRLLRRGTAAEFVKNPPREWWDKRFGLLLFFSDDKGSMDKRIAPKTAAEGTWYHLDITDFVNVDKENQLKITNGMRAVGKSAVLADCQLIARDMEIMLITAEEADKQRPGAAVPAAAPAAAQPVKPASAPAAAAQPVKPAAAPTAAVKAAQALANGDIQLPEMSITPQLTQTSGKITFPAVRRIAGKIPVLKADIFFNLPAPTGWNNATSMVINGKSVSRYNSQGQERLLKRGRYMESIYGKREWWFNGTGLLVYFGPGTGAVDKRIKSSREEGFTYMLDVSDLLNYVEIGLDDRIESAKDNVIQLNNGLFSHAKLGALGKAPLTFKNASIIWMTPEEMAKIRPRQELVSTAAAPTAATLQNGDFKVAVTAAGGLTLERNGEKYFLEAAFSYPAKPDMKFDSFSLNHSKNRAGWKASVKKSGNALVITAQTADRKVVRTVKFTGKFLEISDAVTNLTAKDQPLMSKFAAASTFEVPPHDLHLAGMQGITTETGCGSNPTLYIKGNKSGLGVMALDDAFRCHLELARTGANQAVMQNPTALAANETYTQKQLVMLTDKADYFEFINALRHHLKLNHTLHGPITLGGSKLPPASLQYRVAMAGTNPQWFEYGSVDSLKRPREVFVQQYNKIKAAHNARQSHTILLTYTENSPATVDRNALKNKELLPKNHEKSLSGTYGQVISKEATRVLDNSPWKDSILRAADGRAIIDLYYAAGPDMLSLLVYPYNNNHYQKVMFERTGFLLDKANVDGIYIDQFANGTMYPVERSRDRISFEKWDGRTVLLNSDGTIKSKLFDVGYACSKTRADYIRFVTSRGKFFLANTQPVTTTEAAAGGMRFYESDSENLAPMLLSTGKPPTYRLQAFAQLSPSPILLGCRPARFSKQRELWPKMYNRAFIGGLRHGLLYVHYGFSSALSCYDLVNHMFPLTPVELGEGFIIGKERIITAVSRKFITGTAPKAIIGFDAEGNKLAKVATVRKLAHNKFEIDVKLNDWNSSCVIVLAGYANVAEEQADLKKKSSMNKKINNPAPGQKVLCGPTRSCKYPDAEIEAIGNSYRFHTRNGEGLAERVQECIKNQTPFFLSEIILRNKLRLPADKMYEGSILPAEVARIAAPAGKLFLGRQIMGEYGGMLYWTKNSLGEINYPRMAPAKDLEEARANFFNILKDYGAKERQLGCGPLIGLCSAMIFPPYGSNVFDIFSLEMMPGDPERLSSAIRGNTRAYGNPAFHTLIAHGWYGGGLWDEIYFKRLKNAFNYAYMAGFDGIFSESGHLGFKGYGNNVERSDAQAVEFRQIMKDFREFCDSDRRPWGGPETPMAFMQGNLDGFPGLWASCVWGQFDNPAFASGDAERGWELTKAVYRKRPWFDNMLRGNQDNSGQVPCGLYDIVPADIPLELLKRYKLLVIPGWNTMTDELYRKLQQYVANGGTLLMTLAQMRSNIRRDEPLKLYKDGDFSELFGVKLSLAKTIRVNGLKFCKTESFDGKLLWPDWTDFCDPKFSESDFMAASIQSSTAVNIAEASNNFDGKLDSDAERVPVLLEHSLGKGKAFLINSVEFAGSKNMFDFCHLVISELMRSAQPAELDVLHSENIRYAKYGKTLYVTNQSYDLDGVFKVNGKSYQLKPQELRRIELD